MFFYIDSTDPENPILRVEKTEDTFGVDPLYEFVNPLEFQTRTNTEHLYGQVVVGSEVTVDGQEAWYTMNEAISYYGFKHETFFPLGQCNTNAQLNLVNQWVVSNNVIQDILVASSAIYIDNYILIECDAVDPVTLTANGFPWPFFGQATPPFFYNLGINNYSKMQRHSEKFETAFGNFLGVGGIGYRALLGDDPANDITYMTGAASNPNYIPIGGLSVGADFPNETTNGGYDGSGNYNNVTFQYTVPQDGDYSFHEQLHIEIDGILSVSYFNVNLHVNLYDSGMVLKATQLGGASFLQNGEFLLDSTLVCSAVAGDIIQYDYVLEYQPNGEGSQQNARTLTVIWDSFTECNGTPDGGITITSNNGSIKKLLHEFEYPINQTDWQLIKSNPTGYVTFIREGVTRVGWIDEMVHDDQTGRTKITLRSQRNAII